MRKRLISKLLVLCMIVSMLPLSALAADLNWTESGENNNNYTYKLTSDTDLGDTYTIGQDAAPGTATYTIDLDAYTLTVDTVVIQPGNNLTLSGKTTEGKGVTSNKDTTTFQVGGSLTIDNGVTFLKQVKLEAYSVVRAFAARAVADANTPVDGTITLNGTFDKGLTIAKDVKATLGSDAKVTANGITLENGAVLTLTGGTITGDIVVPEGATLTVAANATVSVTGAVKVAGKITYGEGATLTASDKVIIEEGGTAEAPVGAVQYEYAVTAGENGAVSYSIYENSTATAPITDGTGMIAAGTNGNVYVPSGHKVVFTADPAADYKVYEVQLNGTPVTEGEEAYTYDAPASDGDPATLTLENVSAVGSVVAKFQKIDNGGSGGGTGGGGGGGGSTGYAVSVNDTAHGTVSVNPKNASKGDTVTVTVTPNRGYALDTLVVTDRNGKQVELTRVSDTEYTFVMPASAVTVKATFRAALPFSDVSSSDWYYEAVLYAYENGLMGGTSDTTFEPGLNLSRAMMAQLLYNLEGKPAAGAGSTFTDVSGDAWYAEAVNWAVSAGLVGGYGNGTFGPNDSITREQLATFLYRYAEYKGDATSASGSLSGFTDADQVSDWALNALRWAVGEGVVGGIGNGQLAPKGTATRAEVAQLFLNYLG